MTPGDFGISGSDWALIERFLIEPLKKEGYRLYIFGSRARGDHKKFSDLDILVDDSNVKKPLPSHALNSIIESLEDSNLAFRVDLVLINDLALSYDANVKRDMVEVT